MRRPDCEIRWANTAYLRWAAIPSPAKISTWGCLESPSHPISDSHYGLSRGATRRILCPRNDATGFRRSTDECIALGCFWAGPVVGVLISSPGMAPWETHVAELSWIRPAALRGGSLNGSDLGCRVT